MNQPPLRLGFVPAHRGFFSAELAAKARRQMLDVMSRAPDVEVVVPSENDAKLGCVESIKDAERCAEIFRQKDIHGIVIGAVNFGDEQAAAWVVSRRAAGALPASCGPHARSVWIGVMGGDGEVPGIRRLSRDAGNAGALYAGITVLSKSD